MECELTIGDIYDEIAERLALARTKALMGERQEAIGIFQGASLDFTRFRDVLRGCPGYHALEHAFTVTMEALCAEQSIVSPAPESAVAPPASSRARRRSSGRRKAA